MSRVFTIATAAAAAAAVLFLLLPIVAIFSRVPPGDLLSALGSGRAVDALVVSAETNLIALGLILLLGTPTAWPIATRPSRLRDLAVTLVELPLVLPPAVAGIGLLAAFGRLGLVGGHVAWIGNEVAFTKAAVVLAVTFVASPVLPALGDLGVRSGRSDLLRAARTLGAGPARAFFRVALPLAAGGLGSGAALAFARGIGEFGATIMFAGSLRGVTQSLPLAIYEAFDIDFHLALSVSAELVAISAAVLLVAKLLTRWRSASTSPFLAAPSSSR